MPYSSFVVIWWLEKKNRFINRDDLDFDNAESTAPTQEWELVEDSHGQIAEYHTR
jgi:hypothetical protein